MKKRNLLILQLVLISIFIPNQLLSQHTLSKNKFGPIITDWLQQNKKKYQLNSNDIIDLKVHNSYYSKKTKINHIYLKQYYKDIEIYNTTSGVAIKSDTVFYFSNNLIPNTESKINTGISKISPTLAIKNVVSKYQLGTIKDLKKLRSRSAHMHFFSKGGISKKEIPVKLVYQKLNNRTVKLAWDLSIHSTNSNHWYSVRVDAISGEILDTKDWILTCDIHHSPMHNFINQKNKSRTPVKPKDDLFSDGSQYNIFPLPTESPNHGSINLVSAPSNDVASPFGWHDTNGLIGPEYTTTKGNNVHSIDDNGFSPDGGGNLDFNFNYSASEDVTVDKSVSLTNLFYVNNTCHDLLYQYGFDEASGNFQQNNYRNGGLENDYMIATNSIGVGANAASIGVPPDGTNPDMGLATWYTRKSNVTINNGSLSGTYFAAGSNFGLSITTDITNDLVLVTDDNMGTSTDPNDSCDAIINTSALSGKIALLRESGVCDFDEKIYACELAGAIAAIVVNDVSGTPIPKEPILTGFFLTIPSFLMSQSEGEALISAVKNGETINVTIPKDNFFDVGLDNAVIIHEYVHGLSIRLVGGPGTNCLGGSEQMGEGWSDWYALMFTMKASDLMDQSRGIGTYVLGQNNDGDGIRPFPYNTDISVNPVTYDDTNDEQNFSIPHGIGFIWASILWDLSWKYIEKYGFSPDIQEGNAGNNKILQIVTNALKLTNCDPGFVDGRDAILATDIALTGGEDQCMIWEVFAARGVGLNASQGTANSRTDQVEDFNLPPDSDSSLTNCTTLSTDSYENLNLYKIFPNPTEDKLTITTKRNFGIVTLTLIDINGKTILKKRASLIDQLNLDMNTIESGVYFLNIKGNNINTNNKIIKL